MSILNKSLYGAVVEAGADKKRKLAIYYQGTRISYGSFIKKVDEMANILVDKLGVKPYDVILISQPNIPQTLILFYAVNKIGAIANMVHPFTPFNQLQDIARKTHAKYLFLFEQRIAKEVEAYRENCDNVYVTRIEDYLPPLKRIIYHFMNSKIRKKLGKYMKFPGFKYLKDVKPGSYQVDEFPWNVKNTAVILHSGSTTGDPKAICISNYAFNYIVSCNETFYNLTKKQLEGRGMLSVLPSFHGFGLNMTMHMPLANGYHAVLIPKFSPKAVGEAMNKVNVSFVIGVPTMIESMINDPKFCKNKNIKNIYAAHCGGDMMRPDTKKKFDDLMARHGSPCRIFEGYGLTEVVAANCLNYRYDNRAGSIGKPYGDIVFKILDENRNEVPRNVVGEIAIKSPTVMNGYYGDEAATKATFYGDYLLTGDLGYIDEDGFIFFKTRKKRVIKVSGVAVFPNEIEKIVLDTPSVQTCVAIRIPDPKMESAIKLFVKSDSFDEEGLRRAILERCRRYLIKWAVPKEIEFVKEIPFTKYNKVDFNAVQKMEDQKRGIN